MGKITTIRGLQKVKSRSEKSSMKRKEVGSRGRYHVDDMRPVNKSTYEKGRLNNLCFPFMSCLKSVCFSYC